VEYSQDVFDDISREFSAFCRKLGIAHIYFVPMSALNGDMVVDRGENLDWYKGSTLLDLLETSRVAETLSPALRFPVQLISRPQLPELHDFRGYMGRIESGTVNVGDEMTVLPSGNTTKVKDIVTLSGSLKSAHAPQSITLLLENEIDISRGDMLVHADTPPRVSKEFAAMLCWMDNAPLDTRRKYLIKHTTQTVKAVFTQLDFLLDVNSLEHKDAPENLKLNDIAQVQIKVQKPLMIDAYKNNRATGSFIVIDEATNHTVAAGIISI
jgi:sulfate adenylyltransferase subunit 1